MARLTISAQDLLVHTLKKEVVSYRTQRIYKSRKFYSAVSFLKRNNYINAVCVVCRRKIKDDHRNTCSGRKCEDRKLTTYKMFELTLKGEIVAHELRSLI